MSIRTESLTSDHATSPWIGNEHLRWRLLCCVRRWPCLFLQLRLRSAVPHSQLPHSLAAAVVGAMVAVSAAVILAAASVHVAAMETTEVSGHVAATEAAAKMTAAETAAKMTAAETATVAPTTAAASECGS